MRTRDLLVPALTMLLLAAAGAARAEDPEIERRLAEQDGLAARGETVRLLNEAKAALSREETSANRYLLGRAYGMVRELEKAREQFDWAVELDPRNAYAYFGLGVYHMMKGNAEEATRMLGAALKLDPRLRRARLELVKLELSLGELVAAEREAGQLLADFPEDLEGRELLGHVYFRRKLFPRATAEFRFVKARRPDDLEVRKLLAVALHMAGDGAASAAEFREITQRWPEDWESWFGLSQALLGTEDVEGAKAALDHVIAAAGPDSRAGRAAAEERARIEAEGAGRRVSVEDLLAKLDSEDLRERRSAMRMLTGLGIYPPPRRMVQAVRDPDELVRVFAVRNLGAVGGRHSLGLVEVLLLHPKDRDGSPRVRGACASAVGAIGSEAGIPVLLAALADESDYVFGIVVQSLRDLTGTYFTERPTDRAGAADRARLVAAWGEWWRGGRAYSLKLDTIEAIEGLENARLGRYLVPLLADPDLEVSRKALEAFWLLTGLKPGEAADCATPEGRERLRQRAEELLGEAE